MKGKDIPAISAIKNSLHNVIKVYKEAVHDGERDSCDGCYHQSGWKEHLKMHNLSCLKLTTQQKFNQRENIRWDVL